MGPRLPSGPERLGMIGRQTVVALGPLDEAVKLAAGGASAASAFLSRSDFADGSIDPHGVTFLGD